MQVATLLEDRARTDIVSCAPDASLHDAVRLLAENRIGAMPVMEGDRVVGTGDLHGGLLGRGPPTHAVAPTNKSPPGS